MNHHFKPAGMLLVGCMAIMLLLGACSDNQDSSSGISLAATSSEVPAGQSVSDSTEEQGSSAIAPDADASAGTLLVMECITSPVLRADMDAYELVPIDTLQIENQGMYISFASLPRTDAELVVANCFLLEITGEYRRNDYLFPQEESWPDHWLEEEGKFPENALYEYVEVSVLQELDEEAAFTATSLRSDAPRPLLQFYHEKYGGNLSYSEYVAQFYADGGRIVYAEWEDRYAEGRMPQLPDGTHADYYLLLSDADGRLFINAHSRMWGELYP